MLSLEEIFTPEISLLRDLRQDLRQRLSYMLSSTEQVIQRSEISSEETQQMATALGSAFYETHLLLKIYEVELSRRLGKVILEVSTDDDSGFDPSIVH